MKATLALLSILLVAFVAIGCKHPPSIVGKWKGTVFQVDASAEFKDDKNLTIDMKQSGMGVSLSGSYEMSPKALTVKIGDYKLKSVPDSLTDLAKRYFDPMKGKSFAMTYHFNSEDEIALTYQGKTDVLKREVEAE